MSATKLMTAGGGGVSLSPASSISSDVTVNVPVTGVDGGTLVCSDSSGNVGIGTSSPVTKLQVKTQTDANIGFQNSSYATGGIKLNVFNDAASANVPLDINAQTIQFGAGGSERMRIDSSGNLCIGTTTSTSKISINGVGGSVAQTLFANGWGSGIGAFATLKAANTSNADVIYFETSAAQVGKIAITSTSTSYGTSSDYRLKENIQPMQNALATVAQLNPVTYTWKADGSDGQGFIAHELQAVVPDCVTGEKDAVDAEGKPVYQGIDTSFLVATLTAAIKEQQVQIETLTAKVAALEAK